MTDLMRSTTARWALGIALWSVLLALATFAFVYWQTAAFLREELAETLRLEVRAAAADPAGAAARVDTWVAMDLHATHYGGLFGPDGGRRSGNLDAVPPDLARDGEAYRVGARVDIAGHRLDDEIWAAALALADGSTVVVAHDADEIDGCGPGACAPSASGWCRPLCSPAWAACCSPAARAAGSPPPRRRWRR